MDRLYLYCAAIGGALMAGQLLLSLLGFAEHDTFEGGHGLDLHDATGSEGELHADHLERGGGDWFVGILSLRSIIAALAVFGLVGLGLHRQFDPPKPAATFLVALAAGGGMMYAVGWTLRSLYRLRSDGTVRIERAVGLSGSTYLRIPGNKSGTGKVTLRIQERIMEYSAMTAEDEIPTGTAVVVRGVIGAGIVEVERARTASPQPIQGGIHA